MLGTNIESNIQTPLDWVLYNMDQCQTLPFNLLFSYSAQTGLLNEVKAMFPEANLTFEDILKLSSEAILKLNEDLEPEELFKLQQELGRNISSSLEVYKRKIEQ